MCCVVSPLERPLSTLIGHSPDVRFRPKADVEGSPDIFQFERKKWGDGASSLRQFKPSRLRSRQVSFRVTGLDPAPFRHLFGLSHAALAARGGQRYLVDSKPGFPDRVEVRDMEIRDSDCLLIAWCHSANFGRDGQRHGRNRY